MAFLPRYIITPRLLKAIASIKVSRHEIIGLLVTASIIEFFGVNDRQAHHLCQKWVQKEFLKVSELAPKL